MLLELAQWLAKDIRAFNVFSYITLRAVLACLTALVHLVHRRAGDDPASSTAYKIGQAVRDDGPQTHLTKAGTPTMGGALILVSVVVTTLLWADLSNRFVWVVLVRDARASARSAGSTTTARSCSAIRRACRRAGEVLLAVGDRRGGRVLHRVHARTCRRRPSSSCRSSSRSPIRSARSASSSMTYFVIVGTSNAVNLTDGLDGLAIMPTVMIGSALGVFAYVAGHAVFSKYLGFPYIPGAGELTVICGALAGAGLAFLWFNAYPAEVFMGDVGALALGAALGTIAVIVRQEIVLFIMGGVFVVETLSVMLQVASFKLTGKRIFRMAPLHHHYELKGWKENQVVVRFWIITMMLVLVGLSTLKLR